MPLVLVKDNDSDELVEVTEEVHSQLEQLMLTAVDTSTEWGVVEKAMEGLLNTGRVYQQCSVLDLKASKPNWVM